MMPYGYSYKQHPLPDCVKPSFVIFDIWHPDTQPWASECPDVKNYKWWLNPVWHRMLFISHTSHTAETP